MAAGCHCLATVLKLFKQPRFLTTRAALNHNDHRQAGDRVTQPQAVNENSRAARVK